MVSLEIIRVQGKILQTEEIVLMRLGIYIQIHICMLQQITIKEAMNLKEIIYGREERKRVHDVIIL